MPSHEPLPSGTPLSLRARTPAGSSPYPRPVRLLLTLEELEPRNLLSPVDGVAMPLLDAIPATASPLADYGYAIYSPGQVRAAYGFSGLPYDGRGQTIAIVAAYDDPSIARDLSTFDWTFGLPGPTQASVASFFTKVNQYGQAGNYPAGNALWSAEIALDVEWTHAIAPGAHILLVEANSGRAGDLLTAVNTARSTPGVSVVSMSWGTTEFNAESYFDGFFTTPTNHIAGNTPGGITFVAAAGDSGAGYGPDWPAVSPNVLGVGGSTLSINGYTYTGETAWSGGGGGYSRYTARPSWQTTSSSAYRSTPDVAFNANPYTGYYVYSSITPWAGYQGWLQVGGTSAGAPQWAGLVALADQARAAAGRPALDGAQAALYSLPASDFHDITGGSNGYQAKSGYDLATGLGSPYASRIIPNLLLVPGDPGYTVSNVPSNNGASTANQVRSLPRLLDNPGTPPGLSTQTSNQPASTWPAPGQPFENTQTTQNITSRWAQSTSQTTELAGDQAGQTSTNALLAPRGMARGVMGREQGLWQWTADVFGPAEE